MQQRAGPSIGGVDGERPAQQVRGDAAASASGTTPIDCT